MLCLLVFAWVRFEHALKIWGDFSLTTPVNDMQTLKFKIQPIVALFTAVNHFCGSTGSKVMFIHRDCRISSSFRRNYDWRQ